MYSSALNTVQLDPTNNVKRRPADITTSTIDIQYSEYSTSALTGLSDHKGTIYDDYVIALCEPLIL